MRSHDTSRMIHLEAIPADATLQERPGSEPAPLTWCCAATRKMVVALLGSDHNQRRLCDGQFDAAVRLRMRLSSVPMLTNLPRRTVSLDMLIESPAEPRPVKADCCPLTTAT